MNEHLSERFSRGRKAQFRKNTGSDPNHAAEPLNRDIRAYVAAANKLPAETAKPWLFKSEVPTSAEILADEDEPVELLENRLSRPWPSRKKYLETHYELLREDAVSPLRDAVCQFKRTPDMSDDRQLVHVAGFTFAPQGIAARIQFSTARAGKSIAWDYSKRLISGAMVALTPSNDNFQKKCIIAIVAARPLENVKATPCQIDIFFARHDEIEVDPQREFVMIEARSGYFEGARHTLKALQKLSQEKFPLAEHICNLNTAVPPPSYLKSQPNTNLSSAFSDPRQRQNASGLDILSDWPSPPEDTLDQSQWAALRQMLTNSLSIVQGPPGTGKTHVSVVGLRVLVENKSSSDPPIIVAAQTNHALDQILGHISNFEDNYIRLGGRSKKPEVKKHTVYEIRKKNNVRPPLGSLLGHATRAQSELAKAMIETLGPLASAGEARPLAPDFLRNLGIITPAQAESLITHANQWVSSSVGEPQDAMLLWLNKEVIPFEVVYERDVFSYVEEEKDEEYEQLKELEAEQGIDEDEDAEYLRGPFRILEDRYTCRITLSLQKQAEVELGQKSDLWDIPQRIRGGVYRLFQDRAKAIILKSFRDQARKYVEITQNRQIGKWERDAVLLQKANVIGMTTTGFSKYRPLVASLRPKIVLIEEAAEVIESPVTVVCVESLEHLILVGDHQQLQGHCNVQELEEVFHLNVSMFERLVHNNMPFKTLTRQRRMDPEIRRALAPIYQDLEDHPAVLGRPPVPGMGEVRSFFFDHSWSEGSDSMLSKYNEQEAEFIVGFFCYLVRGGLIPPHGITVLTFYNGQRKLILKLLKQQGFLAGEYINVNTVDSYQGEENAIVLLSLVRSNEQGQIGFLAAANRVCVALSRARLGFYIFGNVSLLSQDPLWNQVIEIMSNNPNRVGDCLPIRCIKHDRLSEIQYPRDWDGRFGCNCKCGEMLECGHKCPLTCHQFSHQAVICKVECKRSLNCGHPCANRCGEDCICNHKCADFIRLSENQGRGPPSPPMEVRGNNKDGNKLHLGSGSPNPSSNHTAARPRTLAFQATVSSSNSASSDPFGRLTAEGQVQSRTNWGAYANGGVKNDDLLRDEVAEQRKQQFNEQNMHLLDINDGPLDDNGRVGDESSGPVRKQTQRALTNGRVLHHHEYVPGNGKKKRGLQNGVARTSSRSPEKEKVNEVVSLIDL